MKLILISVLFMLLSPTLSIGQDYVPFPTESASWKQAQEFEGIGFGGWFNTTYFMEGDTTINTQLYQKIFIDTNESDGIHYAGALRETPEKKIFFRPHENLVYGSYFYQELNIAQFPNDTTDFLLYDFDNIQVGDTINYENNIGFDLYSYVVSDISQIDIDGEMRNKYDLERNAANEAIFPSWIYIPESTFFIEGIGGSKGLLTPYHIYDYYGINCILTCFETTDVFWEHELPLSYPEVISCTIDFGHGVTEHMDNAVQIYPNPCKAVLNIDASLTGTVTLKKLVIFNSSGHEIAVKTIHISKDQLQIDVTELETGIYMLLLISDEGARFSTKFSVE